MNLRKYGVPPFRVAVIHGGPGARGEMAPVARDLSKARGILEPLQAALTIEGEVEELRQTLAENGTPPITLIGYSWGAWLSFMLAARYPSLVYKLILVGSAPFTQEYALDTDRTRFERLNSSQREEVQSLKAGLDDPAYTGDKDVLMARLGKLFSRADSFDALPHTSEADCRWDIFSAVWPEALALRRSGELLALGKDIKCPLVAIHGDYDPHPADGVRIPLSNVLKDFRFILLQKCGHVPWFESQARETFYKIVREEISNV